MTYLFDIQHEGAELAAAGKLSLLFARIPIGTDVKGNRLEEHTAAMKLAEMVQVSAPPTSHHMIMVEKKLAEESLENKSCPHTKYRDAVMRYDKVLRDALGFSEQISKSLTSLNENYLDVSKKTSTVDTNCQTLLKEQEALTSTANELKSKLKFFNKAHQLSSQLKTNEMAMKLVTSPNLHETIKGLEVAMNFMLKNSEWKEARKYHGVFVRLQERLFNAVKSHFVSQLRGAVASLRQQARIDKTEIKMSSAKAFIEFQAVATKLEPLIHSIQTKSANSAQYRTLLAQLYQSFAQYRLKLLRGEVEAEWRKEINSLELPSAVRVGCTNIINVLTYEFQLFEHFFEMKKEARPVLDSLLSSLSTIIYTGLRPILIQELDLEPIAEAIQILKNDLLEQQVKPRGESLGALIPVTSRLLTDMQLRLAYRAQIYINEQIACFEPSTSDLDYPDCLVQKKEVKKNAPTEKGEATEEVKGNADKSLHSKLEGDVSYPTLRKTVMCLFKLRECVEAGAFSHLAHEAITHCTNSLRSASVIINNRKGSIHGHLFLIKFLLVLRSQISVLNISRHHQSQLDFSHMKDVISSLVAGSASLQSLLRDGTPNIVKREVNAKKMLEAQLKLTCEHLITRQSDVLVGDLAYALQDLKQANATARAKEKGNEEEYDEDNFKKAAEVLRRMILDEEDKTSKPTSTPRTKLTGTKKKSQRGLKGGLSHLAKNLRVYLKNKNMERMLLDPVCGNVKKVLLNARELISKSKRPEAKRMLSDLLQLESEVITMFQ